MNNIVYQIYNVYTGGSYWGSTINWKARQATHLSSLRSNKHDNGHLQNAWNKYGEENFVLFVLHKFKDKSEMTKCEQNYLDQFIDKDICYNINKNADRGHSSPGSSNPMYGSNRTSKQNPNYKGLHIKLKHKHTDEIIEGYGIVDMANKLGIHKGNLCQMMKGRLKTVAGWRKY